VTIGSRQLFRRSKLAVVTRRLVTHGGRWRGMKRKVAESMAHVLIVTNDTDVRTVLDTLLRSAGHTVLARSASDQALVVLRVSRHPLVVLLHSSLILSDIVSVLQQNGAAAASHLAHHCYVVLEAMPRSMPLTQLNFFTYMYAQVLALPFDLEELEAAVERAEQELESSVMSAVTSHPSGHTTFGEVAHSCRWRRSRCCTASGHRKLRLPPRACCQ
jgi:DNA-binding NtrC family response regulator